MKSLTQNKQSLKPEGFFWSDITTQVFVIKSNGKVIKRFLGKVLIPQNTNSLSMADIKRALWQDVPYQRETDLLVKTAKGS